MLIDDIRKDQITARKNKDGRTASLLTTLLGEAERVGKDNGNRQTSDEEVVAVVKKFIKNMNETLTVVKDRIDADIVTTDTVIAEIEQEISIIEKYLPQQLTETELQDIVRIIVDGLDDKSPKQMGLVMKQLKDNYAGLYDGKVASAIVKEQLS